MRKDEIDRIVSSHIPIPMCVVNGNGKIVSANKYIEEVFIYTDIQDSDFFALTGVKTSDLIHENNGKFIIERNGRKFAIISDEQDGSYMVFFRDITGFVDLKEKYNNEKISICRISIDNYDQFIDTASPEIGFAARAEFDRLIRNWASSMNATVDKIKDTLYKLCFHGGNIDAIIKSNFTILDEVRAIETGMDFQLSLSIGIGVGGSNILETDKLSVTSLELALGRGGDQAVVKDGINTRYFGGRTQSIERGSKGKSRIIGMAVSKLIEQSHRVLIMGHSNADMDALGAALGIYRMCIFKGTEAYIVIDEISDSLSRIYEHVRATEVYNLISTKKARDILTEDTLVVVVDTQRPSYIEAPDIIENANQVVVIDHHRRAEDYIENPTISYIETYASSASEMVTEMLQYVISRKGLVKIEAEALLAGITLDTNRFAVKTGVRTFEAAAWLRRAGADTTTVKRFFQTDMNTFKIRANAIAAAKFHKNGVVTSICEGKNLDASVINSIVADELLNVAGVKASFVAGVNEKGITCISGRSLGDINVQLIAERLGGGGHITTAGAQVNESPEEVIDKVMCMMQEDDKSEGNSKGNN